MPKQRIRTDTKGFPDTIRKNWAKLALLCSLAFSFVLSVAFYYGISPTGGSDNYIYGSTAYSLVSIGKTALLHGGEDGSKWILIAGISLFYRMFGVSRLSGSLFDILALLGTSLLLYLIGKRLYNEKAGLLAAFLYGIFPLAVTQASSMGDDVPMAFFATLAFYLLVLGRDRRRQYFLVCAGLVSIIGFLVTPEEIIVAIPILLILAMDLAAKRTRTELFAIIKFASGMLAGIIAIMFVAYAAAGSPMYIYNQVGPNFANWCSSPGNCSNGFAILNSYLGMMFPYEITHKLAMATIGYVSPIKSAASIINPSQGYQDSPYDFGFYYYFLLLSVLVLLINRERKAALPSVWFAVTLIYMSFGTMSLSHYSPIAIIYPRLTLLFAPPMILLLSFGLVSLAEARKGLPVKPKAARRIAFALVVAILITQSVYLTMYIQYSWYRVLYRAVAAGEFINGLPANATVFMPSSLNFITEYTNQGHDIVFFGMYGQYCNDFGNRSYIIMGANESMSNCSVSVVDVPQVPEWLAKYNVYTSLGSWDPQNLTVYYRS